MRILFLAVFVVSTLLAVSTADLLGAVQKNNQGKNNQGKNGQWNNSKGKNAQNQKNKTGRTTGQATANNKLMARQMAYRSAASKMPKGARITETNFTSGSAPKGSFNETCALRWVLGDQQNKALEQQRKQLAEQKRKQEEAEAARRKQLQQHSKKRSETLFAELKKQISENVSTIGQLEQRFESIGKKRKNLSDAVEMTMAKDGIGKAPVVKARLERIRSEIKAYSEQSGNPAKALGAKWKGSGGSGKQDAPSGAALTKLEEKVVQIKRDRSKLEFDLRKAEGHYKTSKDVLFFCVGELVRAGVKFSTAEQASVRALSE